MNRDVLWTDVDFFRLPGWAIFYLFVYRQGFRIKMDLVHHVGRIVDLYHFKVPLPLELVL